MTKDGIIRSPGIYSDKVDRYEISLYIDDNENFPVVLNQRVNYTLTIGTEQFIGGVRSTETSGSWISPDIYDVTNPSQRLRLSEVLLRHGFVKNEEVRIVFYAEKRELIILKKIII